MINYLHGTIIRKTHQTITVLVGGVVTRDAGG